MSGKGKWIKKAAQQSKFPEYDFYEKLNEHFFFEM
jgi:hypothetical protein